MTATHSAASNLLVAIDISKHRHGGLLTATVVSSFTS
jgi:hypothetical protein